MKTQTTKTVGNLLPTLSHAVNKSANPASRKCVVLSPNLQHRVNSLLRSHSSLVVKQRAEARAAGRPLYPYPVTPPEVKLLKPPVS